MENRSLLTTVIIAVAVIASAVVLGRSFQNRNRAASNVSVTGLGKADFVSDFIVWNASFSKKNMDLKTAYAELAVNRDRIKSYLQAKGIADAEMTFSAVSINKDYDYSYDNAGRSSSVFTGYSLSQSVKVESKDVEKIEKVSREVTELINNNVELNSELPEYYYTKLAELKLEMIAEATKDAKTRAEKIAENAGASLGKLKSASMGVFQITAQNSNESYSWGGAFNTSSKRKTASITVSLTYGVR